MWRRPHGVTGKRKNSLTLWSNCWFHVTYVVKSVTLGQTKVRHGDYTHSIWDFIMNHKFIFTVFWICVKKNPIKNTSWTKMSAANIWSSGLMCVNPEYVFIIVSSIMKVEFQTLFITEFSPRLEILEPFSSVSLIFVSQFNLVHIYS